MAGQTGLYRGSTSVESRTRFGCSILMQRWEATDYGTLPHPGLETKSTRQAGMSTESTVASEDGDSANLMQGTLGRNPGETHSGSFFGSVYLSSRNTQAGLRLPVVAKEDSRCDGSLEARPTMTEIQPPCKLP